MSRTRRFADAIWSGYILTGLTSVLNLVTIPIALAVLGKEAFGLWSAVLQVATLAAVFDLGLGPSLARFVTDYKDRPESGYGTFVKSVLVVGLFQTALFVLASIIVLPALPGIMSIPEHQARSFQMLVAIQLGTTALTFPLRIFSQLLYAHQQLATINALAIAGTILYSAVLLVGLYSGMGINSYPVANWASFLLIQCLTVSLVVKRRLIPKLKGAPISLRILKPLALFSAQVMLIMIGLQLIAFAPTLLITRKLGLMALADWTIGTRLITLGWQLVTRITGASEPILWEMFSRGEICQLRVRLVEVGLLAGSVAALLAGGVVAVNAPFVALWTSSRVQWWTGTDLLLFLWTIISTSALVLNMVPGITKRLAGMKFVYLFEGLALVSLAYMPFMPLRNLWQVSVVLLVSVAFFRFPYGIVRAHTDLSLSRRELVSLIGRCFGSAALVSGAALFTRLATAGQPPMVQLVVNSSLFAGVALPAIYMISLPAGLKTRIRNVLRKVVT